jgi:patatin-like phospholipase/acyl hydrolase
LGHSVRNSNVHPVDDPNHDQVVHPATVFDMMVGTSTGALQAFALVGGNTDEVTQRRVPMPMKQLLELYRELPKKIFEKGWMAQTADFVTLGSSPVPLFPYSREPLEKELDKVYKSTTLRDFDRDGPIAGKPGV